MSQSQDFLIKNSKFHLNQTSSNQIEVNRFLQLKCINNKLLSQIVQKNMSLYKPKTNFYLIK